MLLRVGETGEWAQRHTGQWPNTENDKVTAGGEGGGRGRRRKRKEDACGPTKNANESLHVPGAFRAEWMNCSRVQREDLLLLSEMHLLFCWSDKRRHLKAFPRDKKQQINNKELMVSLHLK